MNGRSLRGPFRRLLPVLLLLSLAEFAAAQTADPTACPAPGVELPPADSGSLSLPPDLPADTDTIYSISVEERRWSMRDVSGSAATGAAGTEPAPWHACVGAWVALRQADLVIQNAYGTVRLKTSLQPLRRILGSREPKPDNLRREDY